MFLRESYITSVVEPGVLGPVAVISFPESQRRLNGPGTASRVLQKNLMAQA